MALWLRTEFGAPRAARGDTTRGTLPPGGVARSTGLSLGSVAEVHKSIVPTQHDSVMRAEGEGERLQCVGVGNVEPAHPDRDVAEHDGLREAVPSGAVQGLGDSV